MAIIRITAGAINVLALCSFPPKLSISSRLFNWITRFSLLARCISNSSSRLFCIIELPITSSWPCLAEARIDCSSLLKPAIFNSIAAYSLAVSASASLSILSTTTNGRLKLPRDLIEIKSLDPPKSSIVFSIKAALSALGTLPKT